MASLAFVLNGQTELTRMAEDLRRIVEAKGQAPALAATADAGRLPLVTAGR